MFEHLQDHGSLKPRSVTSRWFYGQRSQKGLHALQNKTAGTGSISAALSSTNSFGCSVGCFWTRRGKFKFVLQDRNFQNMPWMWRLIGISKQNYNNNKKTGSAAGYKRRVTVESPRSRGKNCPREMKTKPNGLMSAAPAPKLTSC